MIQIMHYIIICMVNRIIIISNITNEFSIFDITILRSVFNYLISIQIAS